MGITLIPTIKIALLGISVSLWWNWTWSEGDKKLANQEIGVISLFCLSYWQEVTSTDRAAALPSLKSQGNFLWKYLGHQRRIIWHRRGAKSQLWEETTPNTLYRLLLKNLSQSYSDPVLYSDKLCFRLTHKYAYIQTLCVITCMGAYAQVATTLPHACICSRHQCN